MRTLISLALFLVTSSALAVPVAINRQDVKFPTQQMVEKQVFAGPLASSTTRVASATAGPTSAAAATLTTFLAQPDMPRNLEISPGGTTGDIEACVITVAGTDFFSRSISETFTFAADATLKVVGNRAFKTVTSVTWPANCESGGFAATWSVGIGEKLGLKRCMLSSGDVFFSTLNYVKEGTAPLLASSPSTISSNTVDFNGTMSSTALFNLYFMQDFQCFP